MTAPPVASRSEMSRRLTFLFAVGAGAAIANLYRAQPLLGFIAGDLQVATTTAGWLVTATQIGYAVGVLLLVPLGDVLDRRRFLPVMVLASAAALLLCALAPSIGVLFALVIIVIIMIDVALQTQALLNRARLFAVSHEARSRLNTALGVGNFIGGAIGSAAATALWSAGGWAAVTITGGALCCFALTVWALGRRGPLVIGEPIRNREAPDTEPHLA